MTMHMPRLGQEPAFHVATLGVRILGRAEGAALVEHVLPPRSLGAPIHTHRHEDEMSLVTHGTVRVLLGEARLTAGPGAVVAKPRGVPHAFWNPTDEVARLIEVIAPPAFADYFAAAAPAFAACPPDLSIMEEAASAFGIAVDLGSIARLAEEEGLRLG